MKNKLTDNDFLAELDPLIERAEKILLGFVCFAGVALAAGVFVGTHTSGLSKMLADRRNKQNMKTE